MRSQTGSDPLAGSFSYAGRGYSDPRGQDLAELIHREVVDHRREAARSRDSSRSSSEMIPERSPEEMTREPRKENFGSPDLGFVAPGNSSIDHLGSSERLLEP